MSTSEKIGIAQAVVLAVAAIFASLGYYLSLKEHREARVERRRGPKRRLLLDAIDELKALAMVIAMPTTVVTRVPEIAEHQQRFHVAIAFTPWAELRDSYELATCEPQNVTSDHVIRVLSEFSWNRRALERGVFDKQYQLTYRDRETGDLPPLEPSEESVD